MQWYSCDRWTITFNPSTIVPLLHLAIYVSANIYHLINCVCLYFIFRCFLFPCLNFNAQLSVDQNVISMAVKEQGRCQSTNQIFLCLHLIFTPYLQWPLCYSFLFWDLKSCCYHQYKYKLSNYSCFTTTTLT
jgi:hypothetical protein